MQQFIRLWASLDVRRQIVVVGATIAMFLAIVGMSRIAAAPNMTLLYAGLEASAAGDVVQSLEQRGVAFEVRGRSIFVEIAERDQLRLTLASEGLPANSNKGYELLDELSGFGTTSQMFDAAYWRAKEGELARTISSGSHIASARVHIATTGSNPFQRGVSPKASISLTAASSSISSQQAKAIRFLVASAVSGLASEDVVVIDSSGALLGTNEETIPAIAGDDKAKVLRDRVQRLLEARVGFGNSVVEVSVETITEREAIREKSFDPNGRVAISTDNEERSNSSTDAGNGSVTVASNLPDESAVNSSDSASNNTETRERVNYEVSETEREIIRAPGAIKRLTVAVLVNDLEVVDANGQSVMAPRSDEEMEALKELVGAAVGFDETRGDIITMKSMELQSIPVSGTLPDVSFLSLTNIDIMSAIQMAVLAIVSLILGLFVLRPLLLRANVSSPLAQVPLIEASENTDKHLDRPNKAKDDGALGVIDGQAVTRATSVQQGGDLDARPTFQRDNGDPVKRLETMIGNRQDETVEILRGWLEDKEERV